MSTETGGPSQGESSIARLLRERCGQLQLVSLSVNRAGLITGCSGHEGVLAAMSPDLVRAGADGPGVREIMPGMWAGVVSHENPSGMTIVLLPSIAGVSSTALGAACSRANVDPAIVREALVPGAHYDAVSAGAITAMLRASATDVAALSEGQTTLQGFTGELTNAYDTIDLLYSVGRSMKQLSQPEIFLGSVCERLFKTLSYRYLAAWLEDDAKLPKWLRGQLVHAGQIPVDTGTLSAIGGSLAQQAVRQNGFMIVEPPESMCGDGSSQVLVQPLMCKGSVCGVIFAGGKYGDDPDVSSYDIQLIEASAGYIDAFTENVALLEEQHLTFMGTLQALTAAIDAKDRYTFGHSERVALMGEQLALALGMSAHEAERLRICGLVHDVGKIGVPEQVLTKPGKLTDEEFGLIKTHPEIGHRILKDIPQLQDVLPGVLYHHERYDGRGYPHRLAGDDIPLFARILSVADTFDAMSSNRSYRPALPRAKVLDEIERCAGSQFDPQIARLVRYVDLSLFDEMFRRHSERLVSAA